MSNLEESNWPEGYEKPVIKRHAVVMTMAPAGCKMGHGLFPFVMKKNKLSEQKDVISVDSMYRRNVYNCQK